MNIQVDSLPADNGSLRPALGLALVVLLVTGLLYSLAGTGLGRLLFPRQATGSIVERDGVAVGSALVAQPFDDARYFQPRPSAANYDPMAAAGSNQARSNPALRERIEAATAEVAARDGITAADVPAELVTQSGSGLDPDLSPAGVRVQVARVAAARRLSPDVVAGLVAEHTQARQFGLLGEPRVNVLALNLALDALDSGAP
ncbi:MAG: potassium-transporting ATPase subunit KdpC [Luteimonas sp.]|nr:potassium-transporting ATPase subunit KdpC [Luteimonas sp.]